MLSSLIERVNETTSISDLFPLLKCLDIDLNEVRQIITARLKELNTNQIHDIFYASSSMEDILPLDVIQHIECFNHSSDTKLISKSFNECSIKNLGL